MNYNVNVPLPDTSVQNQAVQNQAVQKLLSQFDALGGIGWLQRGIEKASSAIRVVAEAPSFQYLNKDDGSPVSEADLASDKILSEWLSSTPWPVVSEESNQSAQNSEVFWLVDPLDGTKEFIAGIPEYTINVALIYRGSPVIGAIAEPATHRLWIAVTKRGIARFHSAPSLKSGEIKNVLKIAVSRFHGDPSIAAAFGEFGEIEFIHRGSAGKFALIADNEADLYVRVGRTMEWDTAAGHCLLQEAGADIFVLDSGLPLSYGKDGFVNPSFFACTDSIRQKVARSLKKIVQI